MSRILVTGVRAPVAVDLIRALSGQGHEVHAADVHRSAIVDRLPVQAFQTHASPVFAASRFRTEALKIGEKMDVIICLCEEIFHWSALDLPLFAPEPDRLLALHSKFDALELAGGLGIAVPATRRLTGTDEGARHAAARSVFKPEFSRFGTQVLIRPAVSRLESLRHDPANPWLMQACIDGEDLSFYALAHAGEVSAFCAYRSGWRTRGGASYYIDPVEPVLSGRLEDVARTLIGGLGLTGQVACDLRQDADGRLWLLECNPRATSGLHLLAHDPAGLAAAFMGAGPVLRTDGTPAFVGPAMWLYGLPKALREGRLTPWRDDRARGRDVLAGLSIAALRDTLGYGWRAVRQGQSLAAGMTADIEYNGGRYGSA
ncbi:ATP-grasp domain-containing protein [Asticcacaulis sp. BYS171W]|uniref:ATP-grasp domain-containing protein n=1 Tax=Asticcacaulis aquaticus TaxID=2984212 RepID=A0ABT5HWZ4_9CAUL|nr:ATP-grasp domain-containing protein [Asticcacaulis aquaticus]MDC7684596.1 ATP-grasp domain-containing protein [Asticcacaulis aquaticus]